MFLKLTNDYVVQKEDISVVERDTKKKTITFFFHNERVRTFITGIGVQEGDTGWLRYLMIEEKYVPDETQRFIFAAAPRK